MGRRVVLVTGSPNGLVASALGRALAGADCTLRYLTRHPKGPNEYHWNPEQGLLDAQSLVGITHVVHLAGAPINGARWSKGDKRKILESRVAGARLLREALSAAGQKTECYLTASAVGYYGLISSTAPLTESPPAGDDFLAWVCVAWEREATLFVEEGVATREARLRFGVVLHPQKGALPKMLTLSKTGIYVVVGSGRQHLSWIDYRDLGASWPMPLPMAGRERITRWLRSRVPIPILSSGW